jgi:hypothetical protein
MRKTPMILAALLVTLPLMADARCFPESMRDALKHISLKREMMVAALSCTGDLGDKYNQLMVKHGSVFDGHTKAVRAHFQRHYGGGGENHFMRFDSRLANEISLKAMLDPGYCGEAFTLIQQLMTESEPLHAVVGGRPVLDHGEGAICKPAPQRQAQRPAAQPKQ